MESQNTKSSEERSGADKQQTQSQDKLGLEDIVRLANKIGLEFAEAKKNLDRYELLKSTVKSRVSIRLEHAGITESKLKRLAEVDPEYVDFLEKLIEARGECEKLRIRYESYKNLFDARRSLLSYQKAEMKLV
jgi:hypothetical protein